MNADRSSTSRRSSTRPWRSTRPGARVGLPGRGLRRRRRPAATGRARCSRPTSEPGSFLESPRPRRRRSTADRRRPDRGPRHGHRPLQAAGADRRGGHGRRLHGRADAPGPPQGGPEGHQAGHGHPQVVARFEAERQALALMDHPNIARVLDAGATDIGPPLLRHGAGPGHPDHRVLRPRAALRSAERLELFVLVCRAVQHAHQKGIIHRDLKPSNVLVTLTTACRCPRSSTSASPRPPAGSSPRRRSSPRFAQLVGTPLYMSPEQAELSGLDVDTRSDIYSPGRAAVRAADRDDAVRRARRCGKAAFDEMRRIIREEEPPTPSTRLSSLGATLATVSANRRSRPAAAGPARCGASWTGS